MSTIEIGGRRYAAGLYWLGRGSAGATARTARRLGRPWCVHQADRTGFAGDDRDASPEGLPALALALLDLIRGEFWMALVEGDAETCDRASGDTVADGTGRYALVKARGGTVLADGVEVFETRAAALAGFERARALGWALHATPGLVAGLPGSGIAALDIAALDEAASRAGAAIRLQAAAQARPRGGWALLSALGLAVLAGIAGAWFERDGLLAWLAGTRARGSSGLPSRAGLFRRGRRRGADHGLPPGADREFPRSFRPGASSASPARRALRTPNSPHSARSSRGGWCCWSAGSWCPAMPRRCSAGWPRRTSRIGMRPPSPTGGPGPRPPSPRSCALAR